MRIVEIHGLRQDALALDARSLRRVALFGTRFTVQSGLFGLFQRVEIVTPAAAEIDFVHQTYLQLVSAGAGLSTQREGLSRLAHMLMERDGVEAIILAGTELSLVFDESNTDFPNVNGAKLHLEAILHRALS